jgi:hypothetical protein
MGHVAPADLSVLVGQHVLYFLGDLLALLVLVGLAALLLLRVFLIVF